MVFIETHTGSPDRGAVKTTRAPKHTIIAPPTQKQWKKKKKRKREKSGRLMCSLLCLFSTQNPLFRAEKALRGEIRHRQHISEHDSSSNEGSKIAELSVCASGTHGGGGLLW